MRGGGNLARLRKGIFDRGWIGVFNRLDEPVSFKMDMARLDFIVSSIIWRMFGVVMRFLLGRW